MTTKTATQKIDAKEISGLKTSARTSNRCCRSCRRCFSCRRCRSCRSCWFAK